MTEKICKKCREPYPADKEFFYGDRGEPDGLRNICKACYHELPSIMRRDAMLRARKEARRRGAKDRRTQRARETRELTP